MRLTDKLLRPLTPRGWRSLRLGLRRMLHPLDWRDVHRTIDPVELEKVAARHRVPGEERRWPKYVDAEKWLPLNARRAQDLGLNRVPAAKRPLRVLDLGSGAGYFLLVCRHLGHTGVGLDTDDIPLYGEMFALLNLPREIARIEKFQPLPAAALLNKNGGQRFDLVTAFSIAFNGHKSPALWSTREWDFFLHDLKTHLLAPGGRVYLDLNPEHDGSFYTPELLAWFRARGGDIDRSKILLRP
ncbi:MAG: hypothetical protein JO117_04640 [Verrucomicrobia bacterium]|nr:hypothetical protein [Verrucomicrobiota bacterium]MBV9658901.1 hypothetical protein [Verrucomicrobiota bacterium]